MADKKKTALKPMTSSEALPSPPKHTEAAEPTWDWTQLFRTGQSFCDHSPKFVHAHHISKWRLIEWKNVFLAFHIDDPSWDTYCTVLGRRTAADVFANPRWSTNVTLPALHSTHKSQSAGCTRDEGSLELQWTQTCTKMHKCGLNVHQVECGPMQGGWVYVQVVYSVRTLAFGLPAGLHSFAQHSIFPRHCHHDAMKIDWAPRPWAFERGSLIFVWSTDHIPLFLLRILRKAIHKSQTEQFLPLHQEYQPQSHCDMRWFDAKPIPVATKQKSKVQLAVCMKQWLLCKVRCVWLCMLPLDDVICPLSHMSLTWGRKLKEKIWLSSRPLKHTVRSSGWKKGHSWFHLSMSFLPLTALYSNTM